MSIKQNKLTLILSIWALILIAMAVWAVASSSFGNIVVAVVVSVLLTVGLTFILAKLIKKHKILRLVTLVLLSCLTLTCGTFCIKWYRPITEEQHIGKITSLVQKNYIDGNRTVFSGNEIQKTGFTVEIIKSLDGKKDCFLVQFEPEYYFYGFIYRNNYYRPLNHSRPGINEFDEQNIEKENRYISVNYAKAYPIIASIIDEQMTSITEDNYYATGYIFTEEICNDWSKSNRSNSWLLFHSNWKLN